MLFKKRSRKPVAIVQSARAEQIPPAAIASARVILPRLEDPVELARRVNLLIDAFYPRDDAETVAGTVLAGLASKGKSLTKAKFDAIRQGAPGSCDDESMVAALCTELGVRTTTYLTHRNPEREDKVEAQVELLVVMRDTGVRNFSHGRMTSATGFRDLAKILREELGPEHLSKP